MKQLTLLVVLGLSASAYSQTASQFCFAKKNVEIFETEREQIGYELFLDKINLKDNYCFKPVFDGLNYALKSIETNEVFTVSNNGFVFGMVDKQVTDPNPPLLGLYGVARVYVSGTFGDKGFNLHRSKVSVSFDWTDDFLETFGSGHLSPDNLEFDYLLE